jgi:hypothetical protein
VKHKYKQIPPKNLKMFKAVSQRAKECVYKDSSVNFTVNQFFKVFTFCAIYLAVSSSSPVPEAKPDPQVFLTHPSLITPWGQFVAGAPLVIGPQPFVVGPSPLVVGPSGIVVASPPEVVQINGK